MTREIGDKSGSNLRYLSREGGCDGCFINDQIELLRCLEEDVTRRKSAKVLRMDGKSKSEQEEQISETIGCLVETCRVYCWKRIPPKTS